MNSLKLLLRFSYKPNTLGLCGRKEQEIYKLIDKEWTPNELAKVESFVKDLKVLYAYLKSIGNACGKAPFDKDVVRACLIGWDKWDKFEVAPLLKRNLQKVAIPKKLDEIARLPKVVPFTHSFHTLYFGAVASDIPKVLGFADRCKVSIGKMIDENTAEYNQLLPGLDICNGKMSVETQFVDAQPGEDVFIHHGVVFKKVEGLEKQIYQDNLERVIHATASSW